MDNKSKYFIIKDTLEAFLKNGDDLYFFGMTASANVNKAVTQEKIRAGIGNKVAAVLQTENDVTFSITTGLHYHDIYEIQSGEKFASTKDITIQDVVIGADGAITATEKTVTGNVLDFKADSFPKTHFVQLHTIVIDPDTNEVVADMYFIFEKGLPDGVLAEAFQAGNKTTEVNFSTLVDEDGNYGKIILVPRVPEESAG